ncbi:MAG TPA: dioxygenase [Thiotrichaceae bacterium]|jgi:4,5-DOPA dioxygenase extradiol|nr:dioxygenase [Thiotrichaceae bacterium]HIM08004.1 dioxygenase [Gammaproteobacteria bacterium]
MNSKNLPVIFLSHGSPTIAIEPDNPTVKFWQEITKSIRKPKLILIMSAHWETAEPTITSNPQPETIHDFHGFPESMYTINYPATGATEFAKKLGAELNLDIDPTRGLDHGSWVPLRSMYPDADIPIIQLSICPSKTFKWHLDFGKQFSELSKQNVLIIASGGISHNIRSLRWHEPDAVELWTEEFLEDIHQKLMAEDFTNLCNPESLAHGKLGIPTPDHYLPFLFAIGAGLGRKKQRLFNKINYGTLGMQCYSFGRE